MCVINVINAPNSNTYFIHINKKTTNTLLYMLRKVDTIKVSDELVIGFSYCIFINVYFKYTHGLLPDSFENIFNKTFSKTLTDPFAVKN